MSSAMPEPPISDKAIEVIWSSSKEVFAEIIRRNDGTYQYHIMRRYHEQMYNGEYYDYWELCNRTLSLFDTFENARKEAVVSMQLYA